MIVNAPRRLHALAPGDDLAHLQRRGRRRRAGDEQCPAFSNVAIQLRRCAAAGRDDQIKLPRRIVQPFQVR